MRLMAGGPKSAQTKITHTSPWTRKLGRHTAQACKENWPCHVGSLTRCSCAPGGRTAAGCPGAAPPPHRWPAPRSRQTCARREVVRVAGRLRAHTKTAHADADGESHARQPQPSTKSLTPRPTPLRSRDQHRLPAVLELLNGYAQLGLQGTRRGRGGRRRPPVNGAVQGHLHSLRNFAGCSVAPACVPLPAAQESTRVKYDSHLHALPQLAHCLLRPHPHDEGVAKRKRPLLRGRKERCTPTARA